MDTRKISLKKGKEKVKYSSDRSPKFAGTRFIYHIEWRYSHKRGFYANREFSVSRDLFDIEKFNKFFNYKHLFDYNILKNWTLILKDEFIENKEVIKLLREIISPEINIYTLNIIRDNRETARKDINKMLQEKERRLKQKKYKK